MLCKQLFDDLDKVEKRLGGQRYLIPYYPGGRAHPCPTLADYRLFTTLIRFDIAYYPLFKANLRHIRDYPNLQVKLSSQTSAHWQTPSFPHRCFKLSLDVIGVLYMASLDGTRTQLTFLSRPMKRALALFHHIKLLDAVSSNNSSLHNVQK